MPTPAGELERGSCSGLWLTSPNSGLLRRPSRRPQHRQLRPLMLVSVRLAAPLLQAVGLWLLPAPRYASVRWCEGIRDLRRECPESTWGSGIVSMRCRRGARIFASGGFRRTASFSLLLRVMLFPLKTLGCARIASSSVALTFSADASERDNPRSSNTTPFVMCRVLFSDFTYFYPLEYA